MLPYTDPTQVVLVHFSWLGSLLAAALTKKCPRAREAWLPPLQLRTEFKEGFFKCNDDDEIEVLPSSSFFFLLVQVEDRRV